MKAEALVEELRAKYYLRCLDDFIILHESKQCLEEWQDEIRAFLARELKLELHSEKATIFPLHQGVPLLGFRCFHHYRLLKKSNIRHFLRKLDSLKEDERQKSLEGWFAHASWGNTYKLRKRILQKYAI